MKEINIILISFSFLFLVSCQKEEINCKGFDLTEEALSLTFFPTDLDTYYFEDSNGNTLLAEKFSGYTSEEYIQRCGSFPGPSSCTCGRLFERTYAFLDSLPLRSSVIINSDEEQVETLRLTNYFHYEYLLNAHQISNSQNSIDSLSNSLETPNLEVKDHNFGNAISFEIDGLPISKMVIEKGKGMTGFVLNDVLFLRKN